MQLTCKRSLGGLIFLVTLFFCASVNAQPHMGAAGDSLLDEHFDQSGFGQSLGYSHNGFELMVLSERINAGPTGAWGGTRKNGYEYNWAESGATTSTLISDSQHTNLASQIPLEEISKAILVIGANDLFPLPPSSGPSNYQAVYSGIATAGQIDAIATEAVSNVVHAAQAIKDAGVDLIVATAPDYGIAPFTKQFYPNPANRELVDDVVEAWNTEAVSQLTQNVKVPVVDIYRLSKDIWGDHGSENATFRLGGVDLNLSGTGGVSFTDVLLGNPYSPTADTVDAFVHDGIHPNTTIGGIFANLFMTGFNQEHDDVFVPFTEQELLENAGASLGAMYASDTFSASLGGKTYSDYVLSPISEPSADFDNSGLVDGQDLLSWQRGETPGLGSTEELALWELQYGTTVPRVEAAAIPEPSTLLLAIIIHGLFLGSRRR